MAVLPDAVSTVPTIETILPIDRVRRDALIRVMGVSCVIVVKRIVMMWFPANSDSGCFVILY